MARHGVFVSEQATSVGTPVVAQVSIPFVIGAAPVQSAESPATAGSPILCTSLDEAKKKLGYSEDWKNYNLCEFMYSHFTLFGCQPVIFCNMLDVATMKAAVPAADVPVNDHAAKLPLEAMNDTTLIVKAEGGTGTAYVKGTDYTAFYSGDGLVIESLENGAAYNEAKLNIAYSAASPSAVTANIVATGLENIEKCMSLGIVPDLICAPGFSHDTTVAAVMATKAAAINGLFRAKAIIDIDSGASGARTYTDAIAKKASNNFTDLNQIVCWPMLKLGERAFHMSTQLAGLMATVDAGNGGTPHESPSNKSFKTDGMILEDGTPVEQTKAQADMLNTSGGIVTGLAFLSGMTAWGNYTACYPTNTDVKDYFIPISRMFDFVGNTIIRTFWGNIDKPMNRRLIDSIMDTVGIWMNGLVGSGVILGGRTEFSSTENPVTSLMAGIIRVHIYMTPPSPMQEADFVLEYDVSYVLSALGG